MSATPHVGTLGEKPLHAALKRWYAERGDRIEEPVDGFVIDIVRNGVLIEIQTNGFSGMKRKLTTLLDRHAVHVVHPIAVEKWIVRRGESGEVISRRRSPKRGAPVDVFGELVSFPELIAHAGLTIELLLIREEEVRRFDGHKGWRRKGWVVEERRLLEVVDRLVLDSPEALAAILPSAVPPRFTTVDVADALGRHRRLAQQMTYCLRRAGVIEMVGKQRNAIVYSRTDGPAVGPRRAFDAASQLNETEPYEPDAADRRYDARWTGGGRMGTNAVHELLDQHNVAYEVRDHPRAVDASRLAQSEDVTGWDVAKPVLLAIGGQLAMAVIPAPVHVDLDKASAVLGHGEVRLATEEEFISRFPDCEPGAEPPFGNLYGIPVFLDETVRRRQRMVCRNGSHTETITLAVNDYVEVVAPEIVDLATEG